MADSTAQKQCKAWFDRQEAEFLAEIEAKEMLRIASWPAGDIDRKNLIFNKFFHTDTGNENIAE